MNKNNKSVAIFTFIKANNYGAMLQAYALGKFLKNNNIEPVYVDIDMKKKSSGLKSWVRLFFMKLQFNLFRKKYFSLISLSEVQNYQTHIYGSDQIWNREIVKEDLNIFSGSIGMSTANKLAYAASFGVDSINIEEYQEFEDSIKQFSNVMVRESSAVNILKQNFNIHSIQVLDPTFLIDSYDELAISTNKKGISCFLFSDFNRDYVSLKSFSKMTNEELYFLNQTRTPVGKAVPFPKVEDWLSQVINSKYIITDSFHCMVMAILHDINFYVLSARADRFTRISSLLKELGLENRILQSVSLLAKSNFIIKDIDYIPVNKRIKKLKELSKNELKKSLKINKMEKS